MARVLRREKSGYVLGLICCIAGLLLLVVVVWKVSPQVSASQSVLSDLGSYLWAEQVDFPFGFGFKLVYLTVLGVVVVVSGAVLLAFSQKWFTFSGESVFLTCPYCKNHWRASRAKGWAECPHCRKFVKPQVMRTG